MIPDANFTLAKAKAFLRVDHALDDDVITGMLDAAVAQVESITRRAWTERTWTEDVAACDLCGCDTAVFHARLSPGVAVVSDTTVEPPVDFPAAELVHATSYGHTVVRVSGWTVEPGAGNVGTVTWTAKPAGDFVPPDVYAAVMLYLGDLYENREAQVVGTIVAINQAASSLLRSHVVDLHV